jgi:tRNA (guanine10-N2)-methyltransferase
MDNERMLTYKGSRKLITYRRIPDAEVVLGVHEERVRAEGTSADELNPFRKGYFKGFKSVFR